MFCNMEIRRKKKKKELKTMSVISEKFSSSFKKVKNVSKYTASRDSQTLP